MSVKDTKDLRKREVESYRGKKDLHGKPIKISKNPGVLIYGSRYNDKQFWEDAAYAVSNIEDIGLGKSTQSRKISNKKHKTNSNKFSFG